MNRNRWPRASVAAIGLFASLFIGSQTYAANEDPDRVETPTISCDAANAIAVKVYTNARNSLSKLQPISIASLEATKASLVVVDEYSSHCDGIKQIIGTLNGAIAKLKDESLTINSEYFSKFPRETGEPAVNIRGVTPPNLMDRLNIEGLDRRMIEQKIEFEK